MLDFCAAKGIYPDVEFIEMNQVNEAYERLLEERRPLSLRHRHEPGPVSEAVHPVPEDFGARIGPARARRA